MLIAIALLTLGFGDEPPRRWVYSMYNLQVNENVLVVEKIMERAAKAGYNGIVLADFRLNILDRVPDWYFRNLVKVKATAARLKLEIIPCVAPFGYSSGLLVHDPNLAEGLPVKDAEFRVDGVIGELRSSLEKPALPGGDFEEHSDHKLRNWDMQDEPGKYTHVDRSVHRKGNASLRMERSDKSDEYQNCRIAKLINVKPFRQYHVSAWLKSQDFKAVGSTRIFAMAGNGRVLSHSDLGLKATQDWTKHHVVFNSLDNTEVRIYAGVWGLGQGKLWLDDIKLEETAFVNLIERKSCPLKVVGEDGTQYEAGRDFEPIIDKKMHELARIGQFEVYHEPPRLKLSAVTRIKPKEKLRVSFWHTLSVHDQQVPASLSHPKSLELVREQVKRVHGLIGAKTYFLGHDEIRIANWDSPPHKTAGEVLAANISACCKIIKEEANGAAVCVWSDMFDPHHNAVDDYYLVRGSLKESWKGLPQDTIIVNWNSGKAKDSLPFFAKLGHRQILAGYYDGSPTAIRDWKETASSLPGFSGVMYTTWQTKFDDLEAFAKAAWGGKE